MTITTAPSSCPTRPEPATEPHPAVWPSDTPPNPLGVINCTAYSKRDGHIYGEVPLSQVDEMLAANPDAFVWIGLYEPQEQVLLEVQHEFGLHDLAIEDALREDQRTKIEMYPTNLFVVAQTAQMVAGELVLGETSMFMGERFLITIRSGCSLHYQDVRRHCEAVPHRMRMGPGFALYAILDFIVDQFAPVTEVLAGRLRARWQVLGRDEASIARHLDNDLANLDLVLAGSVAADLTLGS